MNALTKAFADADRSYCSAKASIASKVSTLLAQSSVGGISQSIELSHSRSLERHYTGWVYSAVRCIGQRIAGQPIRVGHKSSRAPGSIKATKAFASNLTPLESHPLLDLLANPNQLMVAWSLMFTTVASLELTGRCLWWLPKREQILPIPTHWISQINADTKFESFMVRPPHTGEPITIPADECCYFHYPNPHDPHDVKSPLHACAGAADSDEAQTMSQVALFRHGILPTHAIIVGKDPHPDVPGGMRPRLTGAQQRQVIGAVMRRYSGASKHGEPIVLDGLIEDIKRLSNTPAEMNWLESGKITKARIFQAFGVNPIVAGEVEGANKASATVADRHFVDTCVNPKIELFSQCLTEWLSPMFGDDLVIWIEPAQSNDDELTFEWAQLLASNGVLTAHELRKLSPLGLPEEDAFNGTLVGGQNMEGTNPIEKGIRTIVQREIGGMRAKHIVDLLEYGYKRAAERD